MLAVSQITVQPQPVAGIARKSVQKMYQLFSMNYLDGLPNCFYGSE
jgi:hypothetical protein